MYTYIYLRQLNSVFGSSFTLHFSLFVGLLSFTQFNYYKLLLLFIKFKVLGIDRKNVKALFKLGKVSNKVLRDWKDALEEQEFIFYLLIRVGFHLLPHGGVWCQNFMEQSTNMLQPRPYIIR